ncbi:hypothetical protein LCGC14_2377520, partial [marine sediment metagenome]
TSDKLVDSTQNFETTVSIGDTVHNTTDETYAIVTAVDSDTTLSIDTDIMVSGETYNIEISLGTTSPENSVKSNRDYEIAIVYSDEQSRMFTPMVSKDNTVFVEHTVANKTNHLKVTIPAAQKVPVRAVSYRFFAKQSRIDYDVIIPSLFYEDGVYVWVKYEEADKDKIISGEYLVVKRDTSGFLLTRNVETRILETGYKENNFLRPELTGNEDEDAELRLIVQEAGYYFKMKPEDFSMDLSDIETLEDTSYHNTRKRYDENIDTISSPTIGDAIFYGDNLLGVTSGGTYLPPATSIILGWNEKNNQEDVNKSGR